MVEFKPVRDYENAGDTVYGTLKGLILTKQLRWGERLSEHAVAERLNVSRTPVREALRRLKNEGFVTMKHASGAWVASPSPKDVVDAYALRTHLETLSISIAIRNVTPLLCIRLAEKIEEEEEIFRTRDIAAYYDTNRRFHCVIAAASDNPFLVEYIDAISAKTLVFSVFYEKLFDFDTNPSLTEHRQILEAIEKRDEDRAIGLITQHLYIDAEELEVTLL